jgi:hypothetical protein
MDVLNSASSYDKLLIIIGKLFPDVSFEEGSSFYWSPQNQTVVHNPSSPSEEIGIWSLLHETAHAALGHEIYKTDFELLALEVAAWGDAKKLGEKLDVTINEEHIQDCLDTYRDWLHQRSTCPTCGNGGLQHDPREYRCHNCSTKWHVTASRFCRPYRRKQLTNIKKSPDSVKNQTTFQ